MSTGMRYYIRLTFTLHWLRRMGPLDFLGTPEDGAGLLIDALTYGISCRHFTNNWAKQHVCVCIHVCMIMYVFVRASGMLTSLTVIDTALQRVPVCSWKIISIIAVLYLAAVGQKYTRLTIARK